MDNKREGEAFIRRLEMLIREVSELPAAAPESPDELLMALESALIRSRKSPSWLTSLEQFAWHFSKKLWDSRVYRQIELVRALGTTSGWHSQATIDALQYLDDLVFARTYGALVSPQIKPAVRLLSRRGLFASHELRNLIMNHRIRLSRDGRVVIQESKLLLPTAVLMYAFVTMAIVPFLALVLFAPISVLPKLASLSVYASLYWVCCSLISRFLVSPHLLTPRLQSALPKIMLLRSF